MPNFCVKCGAPLEWRPLLREMRSGCAQRSFLSAVAVATNRSSAAFTTSCVSSQYVHKRQTRHERPG